MTIIYAALIIALAILAGAGMIVVKLNAIHYTLEDLEDERIDLRA